MKETQEEERARKKKELFSHDEVVHGKCLGHGGFADVYEVRSFKPQHERDSTRSMSNIDLRHFFEEHAKDDSGDAKYAIKCLHPELEGTKKLGAAEKDLTSESELLASLDHPGIVKTYGCAGDSEREGPVNSYFLILEKLSMTLDDKIGRWKWQKHRLKVTPALHLLDHNFHSNKKKELMIERLTVCYEIACTLAYLHEERIVYRDLKPTNIGFDHEGNAKLFDFGLSRKLPDDNSKLMDDTFQMSGKIGSCPYMAPEVYKQRPYNEKVDVYGYAIILWEILELRKAFTEYAHDKAVFAEHVFIKGERPPIRHVWPVQVQDLLPKAWSQDMKERPSMEEICIILKDTIRKLQGDDYDGDFHMSKEKREPKHILTGVRRLFHKDSKKPVKSYS